MTATFIPVDILKEAHRLLAEYTYEKRPVQRGYANRTLHINLNDMHIEERPVTEQMKEVFTGGRGFALWLAWNATTPETQWDDPENPLILANGPICGTLSYAGTGKSTVVTISPLTGLVVDSNVGGMFATYLKGAGFDALEITGKADRDVIIVIDGDTGKVTIEEAWLEEPYGHILAETLTEMYAKSERDKRNISVVTAGPGAKYSRFGMLNVSWYDPKRKKVRYKQAARGGTGTVLVDKRVKAIVVRYTGWNALTSNGPAKPELLRKASQRINTEIWELDDKQNQMRKVGTPYLVGIMNDYDLLPVHNWQYGQHPEASKISKAVWISLFTQGVPDGCHYGCQLSCSHAVDNFRLRTGPFKGHLVTVDGPEYENAAGLGANLGIFDPMAVLEINFYVDTYGLDSISFGTTMAFVMELYQRGMLTQEHTGGLDLSWGNADAVLEVLHQIARGEGFGRLVAMGSRWLKDFFHRVYGLDRAFMDDIAMEVKGMEYSFYVTKESLAQQGGYGIANKGPQHDEAWLIFMDMVNNQIPTFEDKAEALHYFPMWRTWFSLHGLCKLPWNDIEPADNAYTDEPHKVPKHVENYCMLHEGVTGIPVTGADLILQSEKVYNFQRIFNIRRGSGLREHDRPPYRSMGPVTVEEYESRRERYDNQLKELGHDIAGLSTEEKIALLRKHREAQYESLLDAVYERRGWTRQGIPTLETLKRLGLDQFPDVVAVVEDALRRTGEHATA